MAKIEEASRKKDELNAEFMTQTKEALNNKMENTEEKREAIISDLKGKLKVIVLIKKPVECRWKDFHLKRRECNFNSPSPSADSCRRNQAKQGVAGTTENRGTKRSEWQIKNRCQSTWREYQADPGASEGACKLIIVGMFAVVRVFVECFNFHLKVCPKFRILQFKSDNWGNSMQRFVRLLCHRSVNIWVKDFPKHDDLLFHRWDDYERLRRWYSGDITRTNLPRLPSHLYLTQSHPHDTLITHSKKFHSTHAPFSWLIH